MPSEVILGLQAGFNERILQYGEPFVNVRTGERFTAIMSAAPSVDPRMEVADDQREMSIIETLRNLIVQGVKFGDVILQPHPLWSIEDLPVPIKWKMTRRLDNAGNFTIKYWMVLVTASDDGF
jgi:hypothetical protein